MIWSGKPNLYVSFCNRLIHSFSTHFLSLSPSPSPSPSPINSILKLEWERFDI